MRKFLIYLSGGRADVLDLIPGARAAFVARGTILLTVTVLLAIGAAQSLGVSLGLNRFLAVVLGGGLGAIYLIFTRVPVMSGASVRRRALSLVPHFLLAIVFGSLVAQVQLIAIFRPEIDSQIMAMQVQAASTFQADQAGSTLGKRAASLQAEVDALQNVIDTGGEATLSAQYDPLLQELTNQLKDAQAREVKDFGAWQCQLYGAYGGQQCLKGAGALAQDDENAYNADKAKVDNLQTQIAQRETLLKSADASAARSRVSTAREELPGVTGELNVTEQQLHQQATTVNNAIQRDNGLLELLTALNDVADQNAAARAATVLLTLFFAALAALPGFVSLIQPLNEYETLLQVVDRQEALRARRSLRREDAILVEVLEREAVHRPRAQRPTVLPPADEAADLALRDMPDMRSQGSPGTAPVSGDTLDGLT